MDIFGWRITRVQDDKFQALDAAWKDLQLLELRKGDIILVRLPGVISNEMREKLRESIESVPRIRELECTALILTGGIEIGVMGPRSDKSRDMVSEQ